MTASRAAANRRIDRHLRPRALARRQSHPNQTRTRARPSGSSNPVEWGL